MESIVLPSIKALHWFLTEAHPTQSAWELLDEKHIHYIRGGGNILCTNSMFNINEAVKVIVYGSYNLELKHHLK